MAASQKTISLPRQLRFNLQSACSFVNNETRQLLEPFDITPKQYDILRLLQEADPKALSIQSVRERLADKMSDASRLIDRLHRKGLLEKTPSDLDRRSNLVRITPAGQKLLKQLGEQSAEIETQLEGKLDQDQIDQLNQLLERLYR
ncbi:MAG: MarR family transcriptional regulator [Bacteroidota bacterium]